MENGCTSNAGPLINPAKLNKLTLSKQQFAKRRKVVIRNLPDVLDVEEIKKKLLQGCDVDDVKLEKNAVTVLFSDAVQAETALKTLNERTFNNCTIKTEFLQPDSLLFVGNLPFDFSEEQFEALMSQYGPIERIVLVRSEITGESKGYGFVEYPNKELAGQAKQSLMNTGSKYIGGRILRVDFAEPNLITYNDLHSKTLFVDKLPRDFTNGEVLKELFSKTGTVTFSQVAVHQQTGASRGFAFVDYATSDEAERGQKAHSGAQIEGSNIRVAYGTPGRTGASILGIQPATSGSQVSNQSSLIEAGSPNIRAAAPQWSAQPPMLSSAPHPLMGRPFMVQDPRPQNIGLVRGPATRCPVPLIASGSLMQACNPRAAMVSRPMMRGAGTGVFGMGSLPQRAVMGGPLVQGPRPLMADIPFLGTGVRPGSPRGFCPRGMALSVDSRHALRSGPIRPLMNLNGNSNVLAQQPPEERVEPNQPFTPQMGQTPPGSIGVQPVNGQIQPHQQPQQLQPLMQQPQPMLQQQQQQQRLASPHLQNNQQPQQMQQPQPLMQDFRPVEVQPHSVLLPKPLLTQQFEGPNVGVQQSGPIAGSVTTGMEPSFDGQGRQPVAPGPVPLLELANGQRAEYQVPRPQAVGAPIPQQGQQFRQPAPAAGGGAAFPVNQSPLKTFLPQAVPEQMVRAPSSGPTPLMAMPSNQNTWVGQQAPQFMNGSQRIQPQVPNDQVVPGQHGILSQPMAPQPLMQQLDQPPNQLTVPQVAVAQRPAVLQTQPDPNIQYQNYGIQQQGLVAEQLGTPFIGEHVQAHQQVQQQQQQQQYTPQPQPQELQQVIQPVQQPIQQPAQQQIAGFPNQPVQGVQSPQQMYQQGPMVSTTPTQWVQPTMNTQQVMSLMSSGQSFQVTPTQQEQQQQLPQQQQQQQQLHDTSGQQWRPIQQPPVQPQPVYGQFQQQPQQAFNPQQQFQPLLQPVDPNYQQNLPQVSGSHTSTPSPIPQHSAGPVMYNTQVSPTEHTQHGQKRPSEQPLTDQTYMNQQQPLQDSSVKVLKTVWEDFIPVMCIEVLYDHETPAMLDGRNNKIVLHEKEFNPLGERDSIALPANMAAVTWSYKTSLVTI